MIMTRQGERFALEIEVDEKQTGTSPALTRSSETKPLVIKDILERTKLLSNNFPAQSLNWRKTGFPEHKKRHPSSKFKQDHESTPKLPMGIFHRSQCHIVNNLPDHSSEGQLRLQIDKENNEKLATMSPDTIASEREELLQRLGPSLVSRLLKRKKTDNGTLIPEREYSMQEKRDSQDRKEIELRSLAASASAAKLTNMIGSVSQPDLSIESKQRHPHLYQSHLSTYNAGNDRASSSYLTEAPLLVEPEPSSPPFLADLVEKYYPNLPHDPIQLTWMSKSAEDANSCSSKQRLTSASALRFSFTGTIIFPDEALQIPVMEGLDHHRDVASSPGFTIAELAHFARSIVPAQRCLAYRTLGRLLYRLGIGEFGTENGRTAGLWKCIEDCKVIEILQQEDRAKIRHMSASAYAAEALWLWRRGGGSRSQDQRF